jgi:hypothetical protein
MPALRFTLISDRVRDNAVAAVRSAVEDSRVTIQGPRRTIPQNDLLWSLLGKIANQHEHCGRKYTKEAWKAIMLHALGHETEFVPSLDGQEIIPIGYSSSNLSVAKMSELIEMITAWGAQNGVVFHEPGD